GGPRCGGGPPRRSRRRRRSSSRRWRRSWSPRPGGATGSVTSASVATMWEPDPGWHPVTGGTGTSTVGVWRTEHDGQALVVKRLAAPTPHDPLEYGERHHFAYWRREADVAISGLVDKTPGL